MQLNLSQDQINALAALEEFITAPFVRKPYFVLHGLAGTGKTFLLALLAQRYPSINLTAFTNKAASVLRRRVGVPVTTLHSVIYDFRGLTQEAEGDEPQPIFVPKGVPLPRRVIALDEASMCGERVARDLLDTGARIIACGDPGQLPPVRDGAFFTTADATLSEIHRQALDSPIIRQAHQIRSAGNYAGDGEGFRVITQPEPEDHLTSDIVLCWRNKTRRRLNARKRALLGLRGPLTRGEPLMCLKNDHKRGLFNGAIYLIEDRGETDGELTLRCDDKLIAVDNGIIEDEDPDYAVRRYDESYLPFAPGYAATVHKAQGSEYDRVMIYDEAQQDWRAFMYTGVTRAVTRCTVVRYRN